MIGYTPSGGEVSVETRKWTNDRRQSAMRSKPVRAHTTLYTHPRNNHGDGQARTRSQTRTPWRRRKSGALPRARESCIRVRRLRVCKHAGLPPHRDDNALASSQRCSPATSKGAGAARDVREGADRCLFGTAATTLNGGLPARGLGFAPMHPFVATCRSVHYVLAHPYTKGATMTLVADPRRRVAPTKRR